MPARMPVEVAAALLKLVTKKITLDESTYVNATTKCRFFEEPYGEFWTKPTLLINGGQRGHPDGGYKKVAESHRKRGIRPPRKRHAPSVLFDKIKTKHPTIIIHENTYIDSQKKMEFTWNGHTFKASPFNVLKMKGPPQTRFERAKKTAEDNFGGVGYKSKDIKQKIDSTTKTKYGTTNPATLPETKNKRTATMLKKYGVAHCMYDPEIAMKAAKNTNHCYAVRHWKTKETLYCVGSYEAAVCLFFNKNQTNYDFQKHIHILPNGQSFRPDFYLPEENLWIEIKGFFRKDAKEKWEMFVSIFFNSELWDKNRLVSLGLVNKSGRTSEEVRSYKLNNRGLQ